MYVLYFLNRNKIPTLYSNVNSKVSIANYRFLKDQDLLISYSVEFFVILYLHFVSGQESSILPSFKIFLSK